MSSLKGTRAISLATVADALDGMLDAQMIGQARIAAQLVAAAEAAGHDARRIIGVFDEVVAATVLDELWVSDETGRVYLTNVRHANGRPMEFTFKPDPAEQPQASKFHALLASDTGSDDVVTQAAQVREIDHEIYKYVGVNGVDRSRIVQVGNALAFEEQGVLTDTYASPVMTAVLAAFGEHDLLAGSYTSRIPEIRVIFEGILGKQMIVQATLVDEFVQCASEAGFSSEDISARLGRIVESSPVGEVRVTTQIGDMTYTAPPAAGGLACAGDLGPIMNGSTRVIDHPTVTDGAMRKFVTVASRHAPRLVQVGITVPDESLLSPNFKPA